LAKPFLKNIYKEWYGAFEDEAASIPKGKLLEIGSGGGFLKEVLPDVITSDIMELPTTDLTFSALDMPFKNEEIGGLFMIDTFHHIPDAHQFLKEVDRVLLPGGKLIMTEPANSTWGRFIYQRFHHEPFDPSGSWSFPSSGPMSGANGALPWIVLIRDQELFARTYPELVIKRIQFHTPLRYLLSGGFSFRGLVPDFSFPFWRWVDRALAGISPQISMFMTVVIEKK